MWVPVVAAISQLVDVPYAEIVASIASRSAGPGTRANIDEFTDTTARAIEQVGGAARGKAIIILNPAEPPVIMRDTVFALVDDPGGVRQAAIRTSIEQMVAEVAEYVPGYRLPYRGAHCSGESCFPYHLGVVEPGGVLRNFHKIAVAPAYPPGISWHKAYPSPIRG